MVLAPQHISDPVSRVIVYALCACVLIFMLVRLPVISCSRLRGICIPLVKCNAPLTPTTFNNYISYYIDCVSLSGLPQETSHTLLPLLLSPQVSVAVHRSEEMLFEFLSSSHHLSGAACRHPSLSVRRTAGRVCLN